jgi:hypothetical protein
MGKPNEFQPFTNSESKSCTYFLTGAGQAATSPFKPEFFGRMFNAQEHTSLPEQLLKHLFGKFKNERQ